MTIPDRIKKLVRMVGLELVEFDCGAEHVKITARIPGDEDIGKLWLDAAALEATDSERALMSLLMYEVESLCAGLHVDWHFRGIRKLEPDAVLLQRGAPCQCGGKAIVRIENDKRVYQCERSIEHVFPRVTVIPHDGMVAVLYADVGP